MFPKWRARYPDPPDLVGVTRIYERCVYLSLCEGAGFGRQDRFVDWRETLSEPTHEPREVDGPVKKANTQLVRSVPKMYKQSLKELLAPYGFKGFKIAELTPNRTRRAQVGRSDGRCYSLPLVMERALISPPSLCSLGWQVCNWILYYKRDLWGVPLSELLAKKEEVTQVTREGETPEQLGNKMVY